MGMPFLKKTTMSVTDYFMKKGEANLTDSEDESENTNGKRTVELRMEEFSSTGLGYSVKVGKKRTRKETGISEEEEIPSKIIKILQKHHQSQPWSSCLQRYSMHIGTSWSQSCLHCHKP